ncbi:uncharacterized protein LOC122048479 [Zingiber officinale]|uniref:uncharacterized protein LOC122048479 n=1 Tax=Zingiber officinale TaxID=94328 RepID=UPI001C4BA49C|nr:uncharacterized protein LOC122048479 [Zingiber officinale]
MAESSLPLYSKKGKALAIPEIFPEDPDERVPFFARILNERLPKGYRAPSIGEYDRRKDSKEHLRKFKNAALLHQYSDAVKCRVFLNTLVGSALKWFDGLPQGSITCFLDFKTVFLRRFTSSKKYQKTYHYLFALKQGSTEPLRSYINRFNQVAQDVPTATSKILMSTFSHGDGRALEKENSSKISLKISLGTLMRWSRKLLAISKWKKHKQLRGKPKDHLLPPTSQKEWYLNHLLNLCRELGRSGLLFIPGQKSDQPPESQPCMPPDLDRGTLGTFTRNSKRAAELGLPPPELAPQVLKMMEGQQAAAGQAGQPRPNLAGPRPTDGDSGRAHKSHVRRLEVHAVGCSQEQAAGPVISFGPADLEGLELPHDDALINKAIIANSRVARVFVDTGSSVNILFRAA